MISSLKRDTIALSTQLLQRGHSPHTTPINAISNFPVQEVSMILMLDQLRPNPDNPRTSKNPKYNEIKTSIFARGLDSVPKVTKDPDSPEESYIFSDGGNTRYQILTELWKETQEERFKQIHCIVKPWPGRLKCVIGHLAENEVRGDLSFIEKAFGIEKAKLIYQEQIGRAVSQRELALFLQTEGYPINQPSISRMEYTIRHLYPHLPILLDSGMGRPAVMQLIALRTAAENAWHTFNLNNTRRELGSFEEIFSTLCRQLDNTEHYTIEIFKDELISALLKAIPNSDITYDRWLIELDPKEQNRRSLFGTPQPVVQPIPSIDKMLNPTTEIPSLESVESKRDRIDIESPFPSHRPEAISTELKNSNGNALTATIQENYDKYQTTNRGMSESIPGLTPATTSFSEEILTQEVTEHFSLPLKGVNKGLEPVTDIWHISALQDDTEHLKNIAYRLAFELAEIFEISHLIVEELSLSSSYAFSILDIDKHYESLGVQLFSALSENTLPLHPNFLSRLLFGEQPHYDDPLLDDTATVKLFRLIRILRRMYEQQNTDNV